jgi:hypothetical protein
VNNMKDYDMNNFAPKIYIFGQDSQLVVVFDSYSSLDVKRAVRCIQIPTAFKQLCFKLDGFDNDSMTDTGDRRTIMGKIKFVSVYEGSEEENEIADCKFVIPAVGKSKNGAFTFPSIEQIEYMIRQGVSNALTEAIIKYYAISDTLTDHRASMAPTCIDMCTSSAVVDNRSKRAISNDESRNYSKIAFAVLGILLLVWGGFKIFTQPSPIEDAVAREMAQYPASVASQVELTRQTLQQMGLDPGVSSDIGCLAPPQ